MFTDLILKILDLDCVECNFNWLSKLPEFNNDAIFGHYILLACLLEIEGFGNMNIIKSQLPEEVERIQDSISSFVFYVFLARTEEQNKYDREVEAELNKCNFNQEQRHFIWKWIRREINLVAIVDSKEEN